MSSQSYFRVTLLGLLYIHKLQKKKYKKLCMWTKSVLELGCIPHNVVLLHRNSGVLNVLMQQQKSHKVLLLTKITFSVI